MSKLSVIVPIYKNEGNIIPFYEDFNENIVPYIDDYEIIMVNDDSPDNSWAVMKGLAARDSHIKLIKHSRNFGAYEAIYTAYQYATGDCITERAADLQEPASLVLEMYEKWKQGTKVVLAIREGRNDSFFGDMFSNLYYHIVRKTITNKMPKGGFDIYLIDKDVAKVLIEMNERNSPLSLQLLWAGFHPENVYYTRQKRKIGKSSWTFAKKMKLFMDSLIGFSYIPIRFMSCVGIFFLLFSIVYGIELIIEKILGKIPVQGYTTIVVIVMFSAGLIMFTLGLLGEYIWRTLEASRKRPISIVEETINCEKK